MANAATCSRCDPANADKCGALETLHRASPIAAYPPREIPVGSIRTVERVELPCLRQLGNFERSLDGKPAFAYGSSPAGVNGAADVSVDGRLSANGGPGGDRGVAQQVGSAEPAPQRGSGSVQRGSA